MTQDTGNLRLRARELSLDLPGTPGRENAITDVGDIAVGFTTIREETPRPGRKLPVRTGVTAIVPHFSSPDPIPTYAGTHRFNGNGEMTGSHWIEDGGYFVGPVLITNTHSVGIAHHAAIKWMLRRYPIYESGDPLWIMPVVAETYDGLLNDINGQHVAEAHVLAALDGAASGPVAEGSVGGGTGMICYDYKGGTGTSSRLISIADKTYTIGVLVQANHGTRDWLTVLGLPVGKVLGGQALATGQRERGSIIVVIATNAPMAPHQLKRLARRATIGIGRGGTPGGNSSGDLFLAFSTANKHPLPHRAPAHMILDIVNDEYVDPVYLAAVECVEEAVLNAMLAATGMGGTPFDKVRIEALPADRLLELLAANGRRPRKG